MLFPPETHADNPPSTWTVVRRAPKLYAVVTKDGVELETRKTKREAAALLTSGFCVDLYEKERRWYAGETVAGWRPFAEVQATRRRKFPASA